ncbi:GNAT family N-acetyltransferase [Microbacterium telephonicum]|uniref:Acetyltransferase (GNAT) family protein n=1 Tax=Microbacterium telephonicum TaxID=1714841 RepID=A0A498CA32_9MICO|nr:GNAT family N-acetyltransferase [Microbacterium telephonicum]RLK49720.1 acetyltransferase (GNAT) family protein [Microbacterium telephonicum]
MADIVIRPASADRFADAEHALTGGGDGSSCWCQWWMLPNKEFSSTSREEKRELLRGDLAARPASALIAYVGDEPAGWVKIAPRTAQPRLQRTRAVQASPEPMDDDAVWAVSCFVVRKEHRRQGLGGALLDAAVAHARAHGARIVEGYPVDAQAKKATSNELFHGALSTFLDAGFVEVARPGAARPIVSLEV